MVFLVEKLRNKAGNATNFQPIFQPIGQYKHIASNLCILQV